MRSPDEIAAEIEGLVAKATPGPWEAIGASIMATGTVDTYDGPVLSSIIWCDSIERSDSDGRHWSAGGSGEANAALIARSPTLLAEAARALRARPSREEVELVLRELVGSCEKAAADERNRQIFNVPSMGSSLDRDEMIRASLRDLGFGQEGEG